MDRTHILHPPSRGVRPPIRQTDRDGDDEQLKLAEELSELEGIPLEVAYSIVSRHGAPRRGGTYERP